MSVANYGGAPADDFRLDRGGQEIQLASPVSTELDRLLHARKTCRNFCPETEVNARQLATMMFRVWAARGMLELAPGVRAVKKTSPAGGGLHAIEAFVLVQRAEGLTPGLYHYRAQHHTVEAIELLSSDDAARTAASFVAGQYWFQHAPVMVVMVARFDRLFWKYRRHAKAWRVLHLDVGHLSQTMYLSAADLGLGAFVTAAINDQDVEKRLGLERCGHAPIAIVGFGARSEQTNMLELDDLVPTEAARQFHSTD